MALFRHVTAYSNYKEPSRSHYHSLITGISRCPTVQILLILGALTIPSYVDAQQGSSPPKPPFDLEAIDQATIKEKDLIGKWRVAWIGSYFNQANSTGMSVTSPTVLNRQPDMEFFDDGRLKLWKDPEELAFWKWNTEGTQEFSVIYASGYVEHCWAIRLTKNAVLLSQMHLFISGGGENTEILLLLLYKDKEKGFTVP